jgi:hypothetical protein
MVQCSQHVIPPAITANLADQRAHDLDVGLDVLSPTVLTRQRLKTIIIRVANETVDHH